MLSINSNLFSMYILYYIIIISVVNISLSNAVKQSLKALVRSIAELLFLVCKSCSFSILHN